MWTKTLASGQLSDRSRDVRLIHGPISLAIAHVATSAYRWLAGRKTREHFP